MSRAFDTINIHTLIRKLLQTNIPGTIIKFIANYINGHKAYTTYRNHTSRQRQFKTGVPQGGVLSPTQFDICTSDLPPPSAPVQVKAYADDITITSTHTSTSAANKYIQPYLQTVFVWPDMTGFPKKIGAWASRRQDKVDTICTVPLDCGTPTTRRLYPFGAILLLLSCHQTAFFHLSTHFLAFSLNV